MGKGERGGRGGESWGGGGGGVNVQKYISVIQCCSGENFFRAKNLFFDDNSRLSASGLNFYDDRERSPLAD
jgi:hypothetical protein